MQLTHARLQQLISYTGCISARIAHLPMQQWHEARLQDSVKQAQALSRDLAAAQHQMSTLEKSLCAAEASCRNAEEDAHQRMWQLDDAKSTAKSARSKAQQVEADSLQLHEALHEQRCASAAAIAELGTQVADLAKSSAAQQDEIAALSATVQARPLPSPQHMAHVETYFGRQCKLRCRLNST